MNHNFNQFLMMSEIQSETVTELQAATELFRFANLYSINFRYC